jgi:hypothetical protein
MRELCFGMVVAKSVGELAGLRIDPATAGARRRLLVNHPGFTHAHERRNPMRKFVLAATAALASTVALASAQAARRPADCLVMVSGRPYMNGPCLFEPGTSGSFTIRSGRRYVHVSTFAPEEPTEGNGWRAGANLGWLRQAGACWQNDDNTDPVKICAWKPGEPRWFAD